MEFSRASSSKCLSSKGKGNEIAGAESIDEKWMGEGLDEDWLQEDVLEQMDFSKIEGKIILKPLGEEEQKYK